MDFPPLDDATRITRLTPLAHDGRPPVPMVLDTDTANEVDDQFALAHALLSPAHMTVEAVYAAPFHNDRSSGPADGMEKSYQEIFRVLERMGRADDHPPVFRGSKCYLPGPDTPVESEAARDLVARGMADRDGPLYVAAIGAITNVASALLMEPRLIERIVVVWLGGQPHDWDSAREFNLQQDLHASRLMFDCGVPLVQVPCSRASELIRTTVPELEAHLAGKNALCDYLVDIVRSYHDDLFAWSKVIWDVAATAWLIDGSWVPTRLTHAPLLTDHYTWSPRSHSPIIREARGANRDAIFGDVFRKLIALGK